MTIDAKALVESLISAFIFLESASDEEIDPELAMRCLDSMSLSLVNLPAAQQIELRALFAAIAADAEDAYRDVINDLPDQIGLAGGAAAPA
jgi:hypothetical protein